jgi:L-threonylcarbamoyladenylate synthase
MDLVSAKLKFDERIMGMEFLSKCTTDVIKKAAQALFDGHLVAFPTETVYGLGADATNSEAVARIYSVKGRPSDHPLIVHIASMQDMDQWSSDIPEYAIKLARAFWPGPMTLILKRTELAKDFITGGQDSVGLRVPDNSVALALLNEFKILGGKGVAAPSANRFGAVSPTTADAVSEELSEYMSTEDLILDGGACEVGVESTIIDCRNEVPRILRPGAITQEMIEELIVITLESIKTSAEVKVSGALESHYAPKAKVVLDVEPEPGDGLIAMASIQTPPGVQRLGAPINTDEYARILYQSLRAADKQGLKRIVVQLPNGAGVAEAIRDRLRKAAF